MFGLFGKPSRSRFAKVVMDAARSAGVVGDFIFDEADFQLRHGSSRLFLRNAYDEYCQADSSRKRQLLENLVSILLQVNQTFTRAQAFDQCVAVVRERALFAFLELRSDSGKLDALPVPHEPISSWYTRAIVLDSPSAMRMVTNEDLKSWEVTFDDLFEAGLQRLRDSTNAHFRQENGYFVGDWNDAYDSSRVLLPELFRALRFNGPPVFCLPNRNTLMVADSKNPDAIIAMVTKAEEIIQSEPRPQNPSLLTYDDGEPADFRSEPSSPLEGIVQRTHGTAGLIYYDEQKAILEEWHSQTGKDIYIGTFTLTEHEFGQFRTYSVWSAGVPTLLPKSDLVMFFDSNQNRTIAAVKWPDVLAAVGDLMLDAKMFPPRFYVSKFPTAEQFAVMAKLPL